MSKHSLRRSDIFISAACLAICSGWILWSSSGHCDDVKAGSSTAPRGFVPRAPAGMKIDGDLSEFAAALSTPLGYFHADQKNRPAQFLYMWDDEAFYSGLRTLDEVGKQANHGGDDRLWEGDAVEWYFDTRAGDAFRSRAWGPGAVHCYWTGLKGKELTPRFCLRPGYLDAIKKLGVQVASRRWKHGLEVEFKLPWANFPEFRPAVGKVIGLDAELCYSDGGPRSDRNFVFGSPLSVQQPAMLAPVELVEKIEPKHWKTCGPVLMPLRVDVPWNQGTLPMTTAQIAVSPTMADQVGRVEFRILNLEGKELAKHEAGKPQLLAPEGGFALLTAQWPVDAAPPGGHQVVAVVYDREGNELTRIAPRLLSVGMSPGY
ncbi:MAG: hypothetical protein K8T91_00225 [Planctomycetes bacterium]|nr:hypothetical protein [Planctomycetota bacterium]